MVLNPLRIAGCRYGWPSILRAGWGGRGGRMQGELSRPTARGGRLVGRGGKQPGGPRRAVGPAAMTDDSPRRLTLEELLALPDPVQRLARLTDLRQRPGGGGD